MSGIACILTYVLCRSLFSSRYPFFNKIIGICRSSSFSTLIQSDAVTRRLTSVHHSSST
ncbi:unnamed protein product [Brugia timori]|uniref:Uncharacterized protein n=1 Tax=Brugia timori TaxID=42155 RepID=A0A3P7TZU4_9BILA|nr:unnamed protein product [Brugia timori]